MALKPASPILARIVSTESTCKPTSLVLVDNFTRPKPTERLWHKVVWGGGHGIRATQEERNPNTTRAVGDSNSASELNARSDE